MKAKRREFMKALGLGSGGFLMSPLTLFSQDSEKVIEQVRTNALAAEEVYVTRNYSTDILIAGGGMSGVCAAIAAARNGSKVILIQDRSRLGGNASSEIRMHISGASQLKQVWRETGILEELVLTEAAENPQRSYEMWDYIMYDKVVSEENITLLLDTVLYDAQVADGELKMIKAICSQTEEIYEIKARLFADCTGDATLAAKAGAEYMWGREAVSQWDESLAVEKADKKTMGNSLLFMSQRHDKPMPFTPPKWARKYTTKDFVHRKIRQWEYGYWWLELGGMEDSVRDGQQNRHDLLSVLFGVWDYIKNSGDHPESENWALSWVGMIPGKRESRRVIGDYIMRQRDVQTPQAFPDRVCYGGWPLDDHPPEGMNSTGIAPYRSIPLKAPYSIPFRSLYSKDIRNLLMAGRNISVSHVALSSTRVMATCATMGQAIGTAMAYCNKEALLPGQLAKEEKHIKKLQQILYRQDQAILDIRNEDEEDIAKAAKVSASSEVAGSPASNVIDGYNRDVKDGNTHQWRAQMKNGSPWIELRWRKPVRLAHVQLVFDTGLHRFLRISPEDSVYNNQERGPQPETVSDYTIEAIRKDKRIVVAAGKDNYLRRVVHSFDVLEVDAIRIVVQKTQGDADARIFEVRCYSDSSPFV